MDYTMKNFLFILAAIFALSTTQARADEGFYAGVFGGANWLEINNKHMSTDFDTGYVVGGAIGYRWCGGLRTEFEVAYRNNEMKKGHLKNRNNSSDSCSDYSNYSNYSDYSCSDSSNNNTRRERLKGHLDTVTYMFNGLYDYQFECTPWKAYVGAGIGYANQKFHAKKRNQNNDCCDDSNYVQTTTIDDCSNYSNYSNNNSNSNNNRKNNRHGRNNNGFAAQAIVGMGYNFCDNIDFSVEYRYLYVSGRKNSNSNNNAIVVGAQTGF